jgi:hypothetical protein
MLSFALVIGAKVRDCVQAGILWKSGQEVLHIISHLSFHRRSELISLCPLPRPNAAKRERLCAAHDCRRCGHRVSRTQSLTSAGNTASPTVDPGSVKADFARPDARESS